MYKAAKVVTVARWAVKTGARRVSIRASRLTSRIAGRMWTMGRRAKVTPLGNRSTMRSYAHHHYRSPAKKGKGWSSNLEFSYKGRQDYVNVHVVHRRPVLRRR